MKKKISIYEDFYFLNLTAARHCSPFHSENLLVKFYIAAY